jgi:hypothetical protein
MGKNLCCVQKGNCCNGEADQSDRTRMMSILRVDTYETTGSIDQDSLSYFGYVWKEFKD